jgi:hypothetical protein
MLAQSRHACTKSKTFLTDIARLHRDLPQPHPFERARQRLVGVGVAVRATISHEVAFATASALARALSGSEAVFAKHFGWAHKLSLVAAGENLRSIKPAPECT